MVDTPPKKKRNKVTNYPVLIAVRVTEQDAKRFASSARAMGKNLSAWARYALRYMTDPNS